MMFAHSSSGNPATPVPTAGKAMDFKPRSFAIFKQCIVQLRSASPVVAPPSRMLAAWITNRAFNFPPVVMAAYPTGMLPISSHSRWMASPPFRRMAPATPPPRIKSLFAALTMASVSISVRSPCWMRILSASGFIFSSERLRLPAFIHSAPLRLQFFRNRLDDPFRVADCLFYIGGGRKPGERTAADARIEPSARDAFSEGSPDPGHRFYKHLWRDIFQHGFVSANSRGIRYST